MSGYVYKSGDSTYGSSGSSSQYGGGSSSSLSPYVYQGSSNSNSGLAQPSSSAANKIGQMSVKGYSSDLVASAITSGALCPKEDLEMLETVKKVAQDAFRDVKARRFAINEAVNKFTNDMNPLIDQVISKVKEVFSNMNSLDEVKIGHLNFMIDYCDKTRDLVSKTVEQQIKLSRLASDGALAEYQGVIDIIFLTRFKEVELLGKRLEVLQQQENHQLKIFTAMHELQLKEEAQHFDQMIKLMEMESGEKEKEFQRVMTGRKQSHLENMDLKKIGLEKYKIDIDVDLARYQAENQKEIDKYKIKEHSSLEKERISADSRARMAEAAASASKCSVM